MSDAKPKRRAKKKPSEAASANKTVTARPAHLWKPGQSGNPNGRPKVVGELKVLARAYTMEGLETLAEIMRDKKAPSAARVAAVGHILDRGYGKPTQHVSAHVRHIREMTDAELLSYLDGADEADGGEGIAEAPGDQGFTH